MRQFLAGMICGAGLLYTAMHYHIVRDEEGVTLVPKLSNNLSSVYVDIRDYELSDWNENKPLAAAIIKSDKPHLVKDESLRSFSGSVNRAVESFFD